MIPSYSFLRRNSDDLRREKLGNQKIEGTEINSTSPFIRKSNSRQALSERDPRDPENEKFEIFLLKSDSSTSLDLLDEFQ